MFYYLEITTWIICRIIFTIFLRLKINGQEKIKSLDKGGVVFFANHSSKLDAFIIGCSLPYSYFKKIKRLRYATDPQYTEDRFYGSTLKFLGAYSIFNAGGDYEKSLGETIEFLKDNQTIVIFPTGKIEDSFYPDNARPGIAYLAKAFDPVLVPVNISNTQKMRPFEFFSFLREAEVTFGEPFRIKDINTDTNDLRKTAKEIMTKAYNI